MTRGKTISIITLLSIILILPFASAIAQEDVVQDDVVQEEDVQDDDAQGDDVQEDDVQQDNVQEGDDEVQVDVELTEFVCDFDVIVQRDDWLSKLSEKFYGDVLAFPVIAEATNTKALEDESYTFIEDVDFIEIGWKLCIVGVEVAEEALGFTLESAPILDDTPQNLDGVINVGAAHALSGPFAANGQSIRNGIDLAVQEINSSVFLGGGVLQVIWEDTAGNKEQAAAAFNKLINEDQVVAILGPTLSRSAFTAIPLAQGAGVPVIGSSNTASGISNLGDFVFHTNLPESAIASNTIQRANELIGLQRVVIVYDNSDAFTQSSKNAFEQALADQDIEVVAAIGFAGGNTDFSSQLAEIASLNPDAIILNALAEEAANIIIQARQLAEGSPNEVRFIGGNSFASPAFLALGGEAANGVISGTAWNVNNISGSNRQFVTDYQAAYGSLPDQLAAQSYTAVWALATALRNADSTDRVAVRDALDDMERIESPLGLFTFDDNRGPSHLPVVQVADDGAFVVLQ